MKKVESKTKNTTGLLIALTWSVFLLQTVMAAPLLLLLLGPPPLHSWHHTGILQESGGGGDSKLGPREDGETVPIGH